ncbi:putative serine/threonine-protein kinase [Haematococcus lacustris]|uniref:Putative serine/threonine-protein kinase n=1 Tax=Haematococcus lacustris TaxID=44745 RepID=A0A6A0A4J7_HAELA|nr:putative serine/threonine-protein kinase [Haematococcus lacustris]
MAPGAWTWLRPMRPDTSHAWPTCSWCLPGVCPPWVPAAWWLVFPHASHAAAEGGVPRSDFGLARVRAAATLHTQALEVGTVAYMAPECFNLDQTGITHKCDIFSLGMVLWELAHWERPWKNLPSAAIIYNAAIAGKRPEFTASEGLCPPRLRKLIEACWAAEPLVRPAAADLAKEICLLAEELDISLPGMHAANA